jgi:hypothetical protein
MLRRLTLSIPLLLLALASMAQAPASHPPFLVVVHPQNGASSVTRDFLADVFLKRATRWPDGETIRPADLDTRSPVRRRFSETIMGRSVSAVRSYWQRIIFSGRGVPPVELDSDAEAIRYVLSHRGAVAYVSGGAAVGRAKVIEVR